MIGHIIGNYKILERIGEGGMGTVYKGVDRMLDREVAIKVLRADLAHRPRLAERFRSEAVTLARVNHPNVTTLYSFIREGDKFFMIMEFVQGRPLDEILTQSGALPLKQAAHWFGQALDGIHHAHCLGIVHRDLKPANIMITEDALAEAGGRMAKVMDFGIARVLGEARLTGTGRLIGTLEYMSPEQIHGKDVDARSDIYALGILLYEMLTGQVPFQADSDYDLMRAQMEQSPRPPGVLMPRLPASVDQLVLRALEKDPAHRFETAAAFHEALEAIVGVSTRPGTTPVPALALPFVEAPVEDAAAEAGAAENLAVDEPAPEAEVFSKTTRVESQQETPVVRPKLTPPDEPAPEPKALSKATPVASEPEPPAVDRRSLPLMRRLSAKHYAGVAVVLILVVVAVVVLRGSGDATPPVQDKEVVEADTVAAQQGGGEAQDTSQQRAEGQPLDRPGDPAHADIPGLLAQARQYIEANHLTTPAGDNAQQVCLHVLQLEPDNTEAVQLLQQIAQRYADWGDDRMQRGETDQAISQYQKGLEVAQSYPGAPDGLVADLQQRLAEAQRRASTPRTGTLRIIVRPFGDIYIEGKPKAKETNQVYSETLPVGVYRVRAVHKSFGSWEKEITVRAGQSHDVLFNFNAEYRLTVTSEPVNAEILVDGQSTGRFTPSVVRLRPGQRTIEVRKQGFKTGRNRLTVEGHARAPLHFSLQRN